MIGEKPAMVEDPRRMEKNAFYIQINNGVGKEVKIPLDKLRGLDGSDIQLVGESLLPVLDTDEQTEQIFNS